MLHQMSVKQYIKVLNKTQRRFKDFFLNLCRGCLTQQFCHVLLCDRVHEDTVSSRVVRCQYFPSINEDDGKDGVELDDVSDGIKPLKDRRQDSWSSAQPCALSLSLNRLIRTYFTVSESCSQSVFTGLLTETNLNVEDPFVVKHSEDEGFLGSVPWAVAHQEGALLFTKAFRINGNGKQSVIWTSFLMSKRNIESVPGWPDEEHVQSPRD